MDTHSTLVRLTELRQEVRHLQDQIKTIHMDVDRAVVAAYTQGASVSAICRAYDTSARQTIIGILRGAGVYRNPGFVGFRADGSSTAADTENPA